MEKGKIIKDDWWSVEYINNGVKEILKIYNDDLVLFLDEDHGKEVEFEIVEEFSHPELFSKIGWGDGQRLAKLKGYPNLNL
jgi:hypothetical protein